MVLNETKTSNWNFFLLICIILTGTILRFHDFFSLPFMFDELCTAGRHYNSLSDLINTGVKENDTHPIGTYVFVYFWEKLFGNAEWVVKLPFVLMGISCIYLTYKIGKLWFNEYCGLFSALYIAALQFTITYSTLARPYIPGLFFSLLMIIYWSNYFFHSNKYQPKYLIGFVVCASACMYTHYFCFLFAVIVSITGLFFLRRGNWLYYMASGILLILLFLPHLSITLFQLSKGGVGGANGWLAPPENNFLIKFIAYIFHYSIVTGGLVSIVALFYFITYLRAPDERNKFRLICFIWFISPFLIGFFYSRRVNPVLQFSVLLFSFPYFILLIGSFIRNQKKGLMAGLIILISCINIYSLVNNRRHYEIMLHQPSSEYANYIIELQKSHPGKKVFALLNTTEASFMDYYKEKHGVNFDYHIFQPKEDNPIKLYEISKGHKCDYLVTGFLPDEYNVLLREEFPKLIYHSEGYTYSIDCFAKKEMPENEWKENYSFETEIHFDTPDQSWYFEHAAVRTDSVTKQKYLALDSSREWGPGFKANLNTLIKNRNSEILATVKLKPFQDIKEGTLVMELKNGDSSFHWQGSELGNYFIRDHEFQTISLSCRMIDLIKPGQDLRNFTLSVYFWNRGKKKFEIYDFSLKVKDGNPLIYGLFEKIIANK